MRKTAWFVGWLFIMIGLLGGCGASDPAHVMPEEQDRVENLEVSEISGKHSESEKSGEIDGAGSGTDKSASSETTKDLKETAKPSAAPKGSLQVHFIDVGQGAAQLIIGPTGKVMLVDAGDNDQEESIVAYLKAQGIDKVDILVGTHPHADHIGGMDAVIEQFDIGAIYMPRFQANTKTFEDVLLAVQSKGLKVQSAKAGIELGWEDDVTVKMVAPVRDYPDANNMSAVIHMAYGETSFLLTGDAEAESEADMVASDVKIAADVLLAGHHGSNTSTGALFLERVNPTYVVIQSGRNNSYGHPHKEVLQRLQDRDVVVYRNDEAGHVIMNSDGESISIQQMNSEKTGAVPPIEKPVTASPAPGQSDTTAVCAAMNVAANVDDATPKQNSTVTVSVAVTDGCGQPIHNADVELVLHYKSKKTTYKGTTDEQGNATLSFQIGRAAIDYTVVGNLTASYDEEFVAAEIQFTPQ